MNESNLVRRLNYLATGDSFLQERELSLHGHIRAADDYMPLVTGDVPTWVADGISFDDGETATLEFNIPQDYATNADQCFLRLHVMPSADSADTTDIGITTAQTIYRAGKAADSTVSDAVAEAATASTGQLVREVVLDISGRGYEPGDHVKLLLDVNNSGTTELILLGIDLIYGSALAAYNDDDRNRATA
jgi:hypothetical protein